MQRIETGFRYPSIARPCLYLIGAVLLVPLFFRPRAEAAWTSLPVPLSNITRGGDRILLLHTYFGPGPDETCKQGDAPEACSCLDFTGEPDVSIARVRSDVTTIVVSSSHSPLDLRKLPRLEQIVIEVHDSNLLPSMMPHQNVTSIRFLFESSRARDEAVSPLLNRFPFADFKKLQHLQLSAPNENDLVFRPPEEVHHSIKPSERNGKCPPPMTLSRLAAVWPFLQKCIPLSKHTPVHSLRVTSFHITKITSEEVRDFGNFLQLYGPLRDILWTVGELDLRDSTLLSGDIEKVTSKVAVKSLLLDSPGRLENLIGYTPLPGEEEIETITFSNGNPEDACVQEKKFILRWERFPNLKQWNCGSFHASRNM